MFAATRSVRRSNRHSWAAGVAALAALIPLGGCTMEHGGRLDVWIGDDVPGGPTDRLHPGEAGAMGSENEVTLAGAINETLSFCLALTAQGARVPGLAVRATALRGEGGTIPANAICVYRVHDVQPPPLPGWHLRSVAPQERAVRVPDVLVPIEAPEGGLPANLPLGESVTLWVDVNIPKGTPPGAYTGAIEVVADGRMLAAIDLRLAVWPFVLPDALDLVLFAELDHAALFAHHVTVEGRPAAVTKEWADHPLAGEFDNLLADGMRLLQSHNVTPLLGKLTPVARVDPDQNVAVEWAGYDRAVEGFLDGLRFVDRQPLPLWRVPFDEDFPPAPEYGAMQSPSYSRVARQYLASCAQHLAERGWLDRSFVKLPHVAVGEAESYAAVRHFGQIAHGADRRLRTLAPLFPQDISAYGWEGFVWEDVSRDVDIWCPPAQFFDRQEMAQELVQGKRAFWSLDRPPFSGSTELWARPADTRVIAWQARACGVEAVDLGPANDWPPVGVRPVSPQACCQGRTAPLIYPGSFCGMSTPIPSVRLKRLRRSMLDVAYLDLLSEVGLGHIGATLSESLAPRAAADAYDAHYADGRCGGWVIEPELWASARQIMADEIIRAISNRPSTVDEVGPTPPANSLAQMGDTVEWRRFMERTRRLEVVIDGVRVRSLGPGAGGRLEVEVSVTLANRTRVPLSGTLAFESQPLSWEPEQPEVAFEEIAPQRSRRITMRATASVMETDAGAVRYLPIVLRSSDRQEYRFAARLAFLAAHPVTRPLTIDGDLADWPSAVGNAAEDFLLITGETPEVTGLPQTRATHPTQCFVAGDGQALYFGFNCARGDKVELPQAQRNSVAYDDGLPIGDELVEILIAPENLDTRSPADFYHVVVKPYGSFWERGIGMNPPVGPRSPWAADVTVAARLHPDRWVAEVRVPLEALGAKIGPRDILGINFTRFDLSAQEFSNWSGAAHNVYDPLAAGNLALP